MFLGEGDEQIIRPADLTELTYLTDSLFGNDAMIMFEI